jgi:hypothetical protein
MATDVKFVHSGMTGAPTLAGVAGGLIAVLDAVLKDGFGLGTVDSVVIAGGVGTVTRSAGHPFEPTSIALIAGASVSGGSINGEQRVLSVTGTTWTFDATGLANQTATGTITHKVAPLGWTKEFSASNLAVYKSADGLATGCRLRVDDTGTTTARVVGYETMSDVSTGTGPFPTSAQVSGGGYWDKSATANGTTRPWIAVGDGRAFYIAVDWNSGAGYGTQFFGDFLSNKSPDAYGCALSASPITLVGWAPATASYCDVAYIDPANNTNMWAAKGVSGFGGSQALRRSASITVGLGSGFSGYLGSSWLSYPNGADSGLYVVPLNISEASPSGCFRGVHPGMYCCPHQVGTGVFSNAEVISSVVGLSGRSMRAINGAGPMMVDVTGPWR